MNSLKEKVCGQEACPQEARARGHVEEGGRGGGRGGGRAAARLEDG